MWPQLIQAGAAIGGALLNRKSAKDAAEAASKAGQLDPRIAKILFGENDSGGLLAKFQGMLDTPRSGAATDFANANNNYLSNYGGADLDAARNAAYRAMGGNSAPQSGGATASLPAYAAGSMIKAPAQNGINLSGSYNSLINGSPGANPFLTGAIQKGINQSSNAFGNMLTDAKLATQDLLGGIRGGAIGAGQFGGSRQALAEGKALDSFNTNIARAASQFGQNNTDAAVAAQAGAYDADRNRQLAATQGLGAQQYGVAQQDAATKNAAEFMNVGNLFDVSKTNAGLAQQNQQFNAGMEHSTNAQNNNSRLAGSGLLSGLLGQAGANVNANDNWSLTRALDVNRLLQPYLSSAPTQNPVSSNSGAAALGGGLAGLSLGNSLGSMFGGGQTSQQFPGGSMGGFTDLFGGKFMNF